MLLVFFTEYVDDNCMSSPPIRDFTGIAYKYLTNGQFIIDLIPLVPLQLIKLEGIANLFYLIKIYRLKKGLNLLNV